MYSEIYVSSLPTITGGTDDWICAVLMAIFGAGVVLLFQNVVLTVQARVGTEDIGAASLLVVFLRTLGGARGLSALGAVLCYRVARTEAATLSGPGPAGIPDLAKLPPAVRGAVETAYGAGASEVFWCAVPCAVLALSCIVGIRGSRHSTRRA
ncbi:hypothetical protein ACWEOE_32405 [Amycolatopsis sp. NPDC004368]